MHSKAAFVILLLSVCGQLATAQKLAIGPDTKLPPHPRILLLKGEETALKKAVLADEALADVHRVILDECDKLLPVPPVERIQIGRRLLDKSREALRRIFSLSYAWRMTQDKKYLDRTEKELLAVSAFSDWNPSHFLDVAEMTMAVAIGYDWLYNDLPESSRSAIREAILKKGIAPSMDAEYNSWLTATHNWNQVCNAGMSYGALAVYEDQPKQAQTVLDRAVKTITLPMHDYASDGAYPEGYSYWGYGTSFNVLFISAMEKALGTDFGLPKQPGFLNTAAYLENMTGPTGTPFNYSDAGGGGSLQPAMFWFAQKTDNPSLLWVERQRLLSGEATRNRKDRILPALLLWGAGIPVAKAQPPTATVWTGAGKNPVALMRTSWTDSNAIFVGLKAGSPSVNHGHMDVGSFVMEANGVRWAMDFGMQDYNSLESKGINIWGKTQHAQRWAVYRYSNQVHNTLTVNDSLQRINGYATITSSSASPAFMHAQTDLSSLYNELAGAKRGVAIVDKNHVVVRDELKTVDKPATVRWTMLTPATVTLLGGNRAELTKDGQKLTLEVAEPAGVTLKTWSTNPPHDYDAPNPGTTLVGFEIEMPANSSGALSVLLLPEKAVGVPKPVPSLSTWPN